jgi:two-component system phosphate regulon sensor histidine kinase PhoR
MFRRLLAWFGLLFAGFLLALGLILCALVEDPSLRRQLIEALLIASMFAAAALVALCSWWSRYFARSVSDLARAVENIGVNARVFLGDNDDFGSLGRTFNRVSERLTTRIAHLEEDRQQLRTILSGMVEGVVALDADQRILFANDRAAELLDLAGPLPVGRPLWEAVRQRSLIDVIRRALDSPEPQREEINWTGVAPRSLTVHAARLAGSPAPLVGGATPHSPPRRGAVLVLHDTTELRRLERLRQDFVANVSHELKTPLSVIKVCVENLQDGAADDSTLRERFLGQVARQTDRLHMLILDLLSLARIESGNEMYDFQPISVEALVLACIERVRPRADSHEQSLEIDGPPGPIAVWGDEEALEQILDNLLDNALKYTPDKGRVRVGWKQEGDQVLIEVSDTGIGIPEADLPRIFERFYRVDKARSREMGGTGLGLSIVKHLVGAMHGSLRAASRVGEGSTFSILLPAAAS